MFKMKSKKHSQEKHDPPAVPPAPGKPEAPASAGPEVAASPSAPEEPAKAPPPAKAESKPEDEKFLRLLADFDNFRRRVLREKVETHRKANEDIIGELLPVVDHMALALKSAEEHKVEGPIIEGFRLVSDQLQGVLSRFGVTPFDAAGQPFDPAWHEAVSHIASETVPENHVIAQTRRGYALGGRLLRAAQVVVSSGNPARTKTPQAEPAGASDSAPPETQATPEA